MRYYLFTQGGLVCGPIESNKPLSIEEWIECENSFNNKWSAQVIIPFDLYPDENAVSENMKKQAEKQFWAIFDQIEESFLSDRQKNMIKRKNEEINYLKRHEEYLKELEAL
jgi:hypothetical protein